MRIHAVTQPLSAELRKIDSSKKSEKDSKTSKSLKTDRTEVSAGAKQLNETNAHFETIAASASAHPDIRAEKIAEVRAKIERGFYNSDEFIDKLADKLLKEIGIKDF